MSPEQQKSLDDLEWDLPYEDIKLYRSFTRNELKKERRIFLPCMTLRVNLPMMPNLLVAVAGFQAGGVGPNS